MTAKWLQEIRDRRERQFREQEQETIEPEPCLLPSMRALRRRGVPIRKIADFFVTSAEVVRRVTADVVVNVAKLRK